jgi:magnesium-transporting ATPase (P-type)
MVLLDDNFASIVTAIEEGRAVFANIRKFLAYILTHNIPELVPYLASVLFKIPPAITIIQILAVDLGTDMLPAVALGAEKPESEAMQRPPRSHNERLVDWRLLARSYLFLGPLEAAAAMGIFLLVLRDGDWIYGNLLASSHPLYLRATTACLSTIIILQMANVFLCRSERRPGFSVGMFGNPLIWAGNMMALALILLIDYTPLGNHVFGTAPIAALVWLWAIACAVGMSFLEEGRKWLSREGLLSRMRLGIEGSAGR